MIVVDTNVVAYHLLRTDPFVEEVQRLAERVPIWIAPPLLRSELRNVLALQHREHDLPIPEAKRLLTQADALFENALLEVDAASILDLVGRCSLSAYDCEYVALAQRETCALATYDSNILDDFPTVAEEPSVIFSD